MSSSERIAPDLAYLGYSGRGNLGDDAIELALARVLPGHALCRLPLYPSDLRPFVRGHNMRAVANSTLLLGGGTVIGRRNWRAHLDAARVIVRRRPFRMIGAGVEDPAFEGLHSFSGRGELAHWRSRLALFDEVTVRGPRSAELLAGIGVEATIVGDPALLLEPPSGVAVQPDLIGVNVGFGDDLWGHDAEAVLEATIAATTTLAGRGLRIRVLVANVADGAMSERVAARLPAGQVEVIAAADPDVYLAAAAECHLVIAQRLHAAILAAAAGVPAVALEYQPKCRDFMESVDAGELSLRTDTVTAAAIVDAVLLADAERSLRSLRLATRVATFRTMQRVRVGQVAKPSVTSAPVGAIR